MIADDVLFRKKLLQSRKITYRLLRVFLLFYEIWIVLQSVVLGMVVVLNSLFVLFMYEFGISVDVKLWHRLVISSIII